MDGLSCAFLRLLECYAMWIGK